MLFPRAGPAREGGAGGVERGGGDEQRGVRFADAGDGGGVASARGGTDGLGAEVVAALPLPSAQSSSSSIRIHTSTSSAKVGTGTATIVHDSIRLLTALGRRMDGSARQ